MFLFFEGFCFCFLGHFRVPFIPVAVQCDISTVFLSVVSVRHKLPFLKIDDVFGSQGFVPALRPPRGQAERPTRRRREFKSPSAPVVLPTQTRPLELTVGGPREGRDLFERPVQEGKHGHLSSVWDGRTRRTHTHTTDAHDAHTRHDGRTHTTHTRDAHTHTTHTLEV